MLPPKPTPSSYKPLNIDLEGLMMYSPPEDNAPNQAQLTTSSRKVPRNKLDEPIKLMSGRNRSTTTNPALSDLSSVEVKQYGKEQ